MTPGPRDPRPARPLRASTGHRVAQSWSGPDCARTDAMTTTYKVGYVIGSLSSTSINRVLSKALIRLARRHRPRRRTAEPARGAELLQRPADHLAGGVHPLPARGLRPDGEVTNESTAEFLRAFMTEFRDHMVRVLTVLPR